MSDVLRTPRLELAPVSMSDRRRLVAHWTGPAVRAHLFGDRNVSGAEITEIIAASERGFALHGYGLWTVRPAGGGPLVGMAGLRRSGADEAEAEIVYSLEPDRWGRGLAAEAAGALLGYAFAATGLRRVTAEVDAPGTVPARVAEGLGMRRHRHDPDGSVHYAAERASA
ncbi:GNAT family N-acetyltransferase [Actinomadura atramentaria]|uniref:GNAT family N-acetyltransferase n=1 Tax=Actinomadura atramentaria TaxID=1990 RepID=UPI000381B565|nr:GNAT family protein [Actinomadura atramentaria]